MDKHSLKKIIYTQTGEVKTGKKDTILRSNAIDSCIVIAAYDEEEKVGAMAHIMLPGKALENKNTQKNKYARNREDFVEFFR